MEELIIYTDGASRGNPGPAGIGVVIADGAGNIIREVSDYIGETTNNVAEYRALLRGLAEARDLSARRLKVYTDSELMVRQMSGAYQVKSEGLKPYYDTARARSREFERFSLEHIPREMNKRADKLSKQGCQPTLLGRDRIDPVVTWETATHPVRLILPGGTKSDEGLTIIYEEPDGTVGRVKLVFATDLAKIKFMDGQESVVLVRQENNSGEDKLPELVELHWRRLSPG